MTRPGAPARPPLVNAELTGALTGTRLWRDIRLVDRTGSTNADVAAAAARGYAAEGLVLVAEHQHAGRGRLGRSWYAPPRAGLTFSALLHPDGVPPHRWGWIPLAAGLAVAAALSAAARVDALVKWPNDVLHAQDARKLGGILTERVGTPSGPMAVVGIGVNVSLSEAELPAPEATSLVLAGATVTDRAALLVAVLRELERWYELWRCTAGDAAASGLHEAYTQRCATLGREVRVELPDGTTVAGVARRVDPDGALVVATARGDRTVAAGDVAHVR